MAVYNLCGTNIEIKNKYKYTEKYCKGYEAEEGAVPRFTILIDDEEISRERKKMPLYTPGFVEGQCVYRKICENLSQMGCFMLHSSVVAYENEGYVFTAKSGTGKTTHSRLWEKVFPGAFVVNGDKPIFRMEEDGFYAYGTPWCGKEGYNKNTKVKIKAVCFLAQGKENKIRRMKNGEIVREVFEQLLRPSTIDALDKVLTILDRFIMSVPFYHLDCTISDEAAYLSYKTMKGTEK